MRADDCTASEIGLPQSEDIGKVEFESVQFLLHSSRKTVLYRLALNDGFISGSDLQNPDLSPYRSREFARFNVVLKHQVAELQRRDVATSGNYTSYWAGI